MKRVLIVEDEILVRNELVEIAKSIDKDLEVLETGEGAEAYRLLVEYKVDAFFLDINLGYYSGISLAKKIREEVGYQFTPIVFITATSSKELEAYRTTHCYYYIVKPYSKDYVKEVFEKIIRYGIKR